MTQVEPSHDPNYNFMTDMTNQAIAWVGYQKSLTPDKPFFIYFAPGATHAPHHVPKEWIAKYKGKFDQGWDKVREETLARQIKLGVVPEGTKLAPKPEAIKDWDKLTPDEKKLFARQMEVFAGFGEYADTEVGRLIDAIGKAGQLDNTLVFYIIGDNGASAEGGMVGLYNEMTYFNGVHETVPDILKHYNEIGGPSTYPHYAAGWAVAGDSPFEWTKQVASSYGGTRNGIVIHWPKGIQAKGEVRSQWHHVIDIAPTILEAAGLPEPKSVIRDGPDAHRRSQHGLFLRRCQGAGQTHDTVFRDFRQPCHLQRWLAGRNRPPGGVGIQARGRRWRRTPGSYTTRVRISAWRTTWPRRTRRSSKSCKTSS